MLESVDSVRDEVVDEGSMGVEGGPERILERTELELTEDVKCKDEGVGALVEDSTLDSSGEGVDEIDDTDGGKGMS
jgi:hypothetical protein